MEDQERDVLIDRFEAQRSFEAQREAEWLKERDETLMGFRCTYQVTRYDPYLGHLCGERATEGFGGVTVALRLCGKHAEDVQVSVIRHHESEINRIQREAWRKRREMQNRQVVYIAAGDVVQYGPLLKIGRSIDPMKRAKTLGADLLWTGTGSEPMIHRILQEHRVVGEWFQPEPVAAHFKLSLPLFPWRLVWKLS